MWFSGVIIAVLQETNELRDPSFSYQVIHENVDNLRLIMILYIHSNLRNMTYILPFIFIAKYGTSFKLSTLLHIHACSVPPIHTLPSSSSIW